MDWTGRPTLKIIFMLFNKTYLPVELCGKPCSLLSAHTVMEQISKAYQNSEGLCTDVLSNVMVLSLHML